MNTAVNLQSNWAGLLPAILAVLQNPASSTSVQVMKNELERMATAADNWNAVVGEVGRYDAGLNSAEVPPSGEDYNSIVGVVLGKEGKCKEIGTTPARIREVATALSQAEAPEEPPFPSIGKMGAFAGSFMRVAERDCPQILERPLPLTMDPGDLRTDLARTVFAAFAECGINDPDADSAAPYVQWIEMAFPQLRETLSEVMCPFP